MKADAFKWVQKRPYLSYSAILAAERARLEADRAARVALLPWHWSKHVGREYERRGGVESGQARAWFEGVTDSARGRLPLSASDDDLRAAAKEAAKDGESIAGLAGVRGGESLRDLLADHCRRWGIEQPAGWVEDGPAIRRMVCGRWWLRRLRRAQGRRCDKAAIVGGVVRRGLWAYASQDAVERRTEQRKRNARALDKAVVECEASRESLKLADVVAGSIANPEVKRAELMVRIKGCDAIAAENQDACEFWTLTTPSRMHAQRITGAVSDVNPAFDGTTPKEAQLYLTKVWARARAAWKRRGLRVFGLRTAEPHHDGTPHWHLIAYGPARDLRYARRLLRVYAMRDSRDEPGAKKHRFVVLQAKAGTKGAAYAAKYVAKNINAEGMGGDIDHETGRKVTSTVLRVDAWAAVWGIRQFQFFGCPSISVWRTLRRMRGPVAVVGSMLERARSAADDSDFAEFWRAAVRGALSLIYRAADCLTAYGDAAAARVVGVAEAPGRRALLPEKKWSIRWGGAGVAVAFDLPWSCVNNCTGEESIAAAIFA